MRIGDCGAVSDGEFVVAGGETPPLLDQGKRSLDDVAFPVEVGIQARWAATLAALAGPGSNLVAPA